MTASESTVSSAPSRSEVEKTTTALLVASRREDLDHSVLASMLTLAARLTACSPDGRSPSEVSALGADMQAAQAALSWFQLKDATLTSFSERKRDIERQAEKQALQQFVDRKGKFYLWLLVIVAGFLAF